MTPPRSTAATSNFLMAVLSRPLAPTSASPLRMCYRNLARRSDDEDPDEYRSHDSSCRPGCYSGCGWRSWPRRGSSAWCLRLQQRTCLSKREDTSEWRRARTGCRRRRIDGRGLTRLPQRVAGSGPSVRPLAPCLGELCSLALPQLLFRRGHDGGLDLPPALLRRCPARDHADRAEPTPSGSGPADPHSSHTIGAPQLARRSTRLLGALAMVARRPLRFSAAR
jgi:hypothetical protein